MVFIIHPISSSPAQYFDVEFVLLLCTHAA